MLLNKDFAKKREIIQNSLTLVSGKFVNSFKRLDPGKFFLQFGVGFMNF